MERAFILIKVKSGFPTDVVNKVREVKGVKLAYAVLGLNDIIAFMEAPDLESLTNQIVTELKGVKELGRTITCLGVD
ncbi:Lrp/AsnC ligand binding domain-containing protein [candidate division WOR-3 bacterium]|nr:Lrp/AsnC ligand binding domain-containing protein [candidate division WOR-3 bacterium]